VLFLQHPVLVLVFEQSLCHSLARWLGQETSFVDHCLPYFSQWLITCWLSTVYFCRLCLLKVHAEISSLPYPYPPRPCTQGTLPSLLHVLFLSLFIIQIFLWVGVSVSRGICWFILGIDVGTMHAAYLLTCWSASPKRVWSQCLVAWEPSSFLSVTWCREALYGLEVQGVRVLLLFFFFFLLWKYIFDEINISLFIFIIYLGTMVSLCSPGCH
jgi:hypothetical protein